MKFVLLNFKQFLLIMPQYRLLLYSNYITFLKKKAIRRLDGDTFRGPHGSDAIDQTSKILEAKIHTINYHHEKKKKPK